MSNKCRLLTNEEMAQYLDNDVPLQQLDNQLIIDEPVTNFISAQLAYAKSKQGKQAKRNQTAYKRRWFKKGSD